VSAHAAEVLVEALPYLRRFRGSTIVVKYGGNALHDADGDPLDVFASDISLMHSVGLRPVVVHGGGPQISAMLDRLGTVAEFRDGLRVTDADTLDIVRMVLVGKVNKDIVGAINAKAAIAVGISGEDGSFLRAEAKDPELGFVGRVTDVDTSLLEKLLADDLVPVIATIGTDGAGQSFNVNADTAAAAIAVALGAEKLIHLTNVSGVRAVADDPSTHRSRLTVAELEDLLASGALGGGMGPKAESCLEAVRGGVGAAHVLDGRAPHALLVELFTDTGVGTMVTR
jgi:acetylglutamate kinase